MLRLGVLDALFLTLRDGVPIIRHLIAVLLLSAGHPPPSPTQRRLRAARPA